MVEVEVALLFGDGLTLLSSGFNTAYFSGYKTALRGRRIGARALALVSSATFVEALHQGVALAVYGPEASSVSATPGLSLLERALIAAGSVFVSLLVLRQWWPGTGKGRGGN